MDVPVYKTGMMYQQVLIHNLINGVSECLLTIYM